MCLSIVIECPCKDPQDPQSNGSTKKLFSCEFYMNLRSSNFTSDQISDNWWKKSNMPTAGKNECLTGDAR